MKMDSFRFYLKTPPQPIKGIFPWNETKYTCSINNSGKFKLTGKRTITEFKPNSIRSHALQIIKPCFLI
jgi:hypothetical protein